MVTIGFDGIRSIASNRSVPGDGAGGKAYCRLTFDDSAKQQALYGAVVALGLFYQHAAHDKSDRFHHFADSKGGAFHACGCGGTPAAQKPRD
jgi:hypothetical protein